MKPTNPTPRRVIDRARLVLRECLHDVGIEASVTGAVVPGTKLVRVYVVAKKLAKMDLMDHQALLDAMLSQGLTPHERFRVLRVCVFATNAERASFIAGLP